MSILNSPSNEAKILRSVMRILKRAKFALISFFCVASAMVDAQKDEILNGFIQFGKEFLEKALLQWRLPQLINDSNGHLSFQLDSSPTSDAPCPLCRLGTPRDLVVGQWSLVMVSRNLLLTKFSELDRVISRMERNQPTTQPKSFLEWIKGPPDIRCARLSILDSSVSSKYEIGYRIAASGRQRTVIGNWYRDEAGSYVWEMPTPISSIKLCIAFHGYLQNSADLLSLPPQQLGSQSYGASDLSSFNNEQQRQQFLAQQLLEQQRRQQILEEQQKKQPNKQQVLGQERKEQLSKQEVLEQQQKQQLSKQQKEKFVSEQQARKQQEQQEEIKKQQLKNETEAKSDRRKNEKEKVEERPTKLGLNRANLNLSENITTTTTKNWKSFENEFNKTSNAENNKTLIVNEDGGKNNKISVQTSSQQLIDNNNEKNPIGERPILAQNDSDVYEKFADDNVTRNKIGKDVGLSLDLRNKLIVKNDDNNKNKNNLTTTLNVGNCTAQVAELLRRITSISESQNFAENRTVTVANNTENDMVYLSSVIRRTKLANRRCRNRTETTNRRKKRALSLALAQPLASKLALLPAAYAPQRAMSVDGMLANSAIGQQQDVLPFASQILPESAAIGQPPWASVSSGGGGNANGLSQFLVLNQVDSSPISCGNFVVLARLDTRLSHDEVTLAKIAQIREFLERERIETAFNKLERIHCY